MKPTLLAAASLFAPTTSFAQPQQPGTTKMQADLSPISNVENVRSVSPALYRYTQSVLLGEVWKRPGLSRRDRGLITVAALVARNQTAEMAFYMNLALDSGVKAQEVSELITHLAFYSGWGNAMAAVPIAKQVFEQRGVKADQLPPAIVELLPLDKKAEAVRAADVLSPQQGYGQRPDPRTGFGGPFSSGLLHRLAQRVLGHPGGQGRVRSSAELTRAEARCSWAANVRFT
jgi:4-carboxymuconolactone decarboxylase